MECSNVISNASFTSSCPQMKLAKQISHRVNANFTHLSPSRLEASWDRLMDKNPEATFAFKTSINLDRALELAKNETDKKCMKILAWKRKIILELENARKLYNHESEFSLANSILENLKKNKVANCYENAKLAALMMKINGYDNVYVTALKANNFNIDHCVVLFNKDNSPFKKIVNNKTIILDTWLGETDYANNMFKRYRNVYKDELFIPNFGKLGFRDLEKFDMQKNELDILSEKYPELLIKRK